MQTGRVLNERDQRRVKGGSDAVMSHRYGGMMQHNETLLLDTGGFAG
jgi:hypothetical protein